MKTILNNIKIIVIALLIAVSASYASAAWQGAPSTPPDNNVLPLINTSTQTQTKEGGILSGLTMKSPEFCLIDPVTLAEKCVTFGNSWGSGGSGGGEAPGICGGYYLRYNSGSEFYIKETNPELPHEVWGCVKPPTSGKPSCPSGYYTVQSDKSTSNLSEQDYLCVRDGSYKEDQFLPGWPNKISCSSDGYTIIFDLRAKGWSWGSAGAENPNEVTYVAGNDSGQNIYMVWDYSTREFNRVDQQNNLGPAMGKAVGDCVGKSIDQI